MSRPFLWLHELIHYFRKEDHRAVNDFTRVKTNGGS